MHPDYAVGWFKTYFDGVLIKGTDSAIANGQASWRNSPEEGVKEVSILDFFPAEKYGYFALRASLSDGNADRTGKYWQSDEMSIGALVTGAAKRTKRRIMRQISDSDTHFIAERTPESIAIQFNGPLSKKINLIQPQWIGKWLVLEIDIETKTLNMFFSDNII